MPQVAILGSQVLGMTSGEHHGHDPPHPPCTLTGVVIKGSPKMRASGIGVALEYYPTSEDDCCGPGNGTLDKIVHKIRVSGEWAQLVGDPTIPHNGTAKIVTGTPKVYCVV